MATLLRSGTITTAALRTCPHPNFRRLMGIWKFHRPDADAGDQMNLILEVPADHPGQIRAWRNDPNVRTLELGQVQESDFFSHILHDDLDSTSGTFGRRIARTGPPPTAAQAGGHQGKNSARHPAGQRYGNDDPRILRQVQIPSKRFLQRISRRFANPELVQNAQEPQQHERKGESLSGASATVQEKVTREHRNQKPLMLLQFHSCIKRKSQRFRCLIPFLLNQMASSETTYLGKLSRMQSYAPNSRATVSSEARQIRNLQVELFSRLSHTKSISLSLLCPR